MKLVKKFSITFAFAVITVTVFSYFFWYKPKFTFHEKNKPFIYKEKKEDASTILRLKEKAAYIVSYAKANSCNSIYCFLVDMKISSGEKRFFVYNLQKDSIELAGLVAHGSGLSGKDEIQFSNKISSNCTSLGKYKIGKPYMGKFGLAYKLYGLDNTNSNAFNRFVVLHSHSCVPNEEVAPLSICQSWGCPTVAPAFLDKLKYYIDKSNQPVLLSIYY